MTTRPDIVIRPTRPEDFAAIEAISRHVYPSDEPWTANFLASHREVFPEGQLVAEEAATGRVAGMVASLIVAWDDYDHLESYMDFTAGGTFRNHDGTGRTLYGAEVMVDPAMRRRGIGSMLYEARRKLVEELGLLRIRAGARLPGYHRYADRMSIDEYVIKVVNDELRDPTLSFQLHQGFHALAIVPDYYARDPRSRGYAALIEWINLKAATADDYVQHRGRFGQNPKLQDPNSKGS